MTHKVSFFQTTPIVAEVINVPPGTEFPTKNEEKFIITVDQVNHPPHYTSDPSGIECIQITRHRNFNVGNAFKYLWRAGIKDDKKQIEDLQKAIFYIKDEINRLEGKYGN